MRAYRGEQGPHVREQLAAHLAPDVPRGVPNLPFLDAGKSMAVELAGPLGGGGRVQSVGSLRAQEVEHIPGLAVVTDPRGGDFTEKRQPRGAWMQSPIQIEDRTAHRCGPHAWADRLSSGCWRQPDIIDGMF